MLGTLKQLMLRLRPTKNLPHSETVNLLTSLSVTRKRERMLRLSLYVDPHEASSIHCRTPRVSPVTHVYVDRITVKEFLDLQEKHQNVIVLARERERAQDKRELTALAEKRGLTLRGRLVDDGKRKFVAPKYANPDDPSQT